MESFIGALLLVAIGSALLYLLIAFAIIPLYNLYKLNERLK